ncbi:hypothetical protein E2C01_046987 [Portunus trituberculatus]|uniref:Uncharacterized protein n=1 Tax=Portunus trituberculatus TaxID=210409 RepID=A0A5B7G2E6_PORTR|nr:hypothetical protein [Portunus trituberculatus]
MKKVKSLTVLYITLCLFSGKFSIICIKIKTRLTIEQRLSISLDSCRVRREEYVKFSSSSWHSDMDITAGINYLSNNVFVKVNRWPAQVGLDSNTLARLLELHVLN